MKTAVSVPDSVFRAAERAAKRLGLSRSELYSRAVADYVERLRHADVRRRLDDVYAEGSSSIDPPLARAQAKALLHEDW